MTKRLALAQHAYDLDALVKLLECDSMTRDYILDVARGLRANAQTRVDLNNRSAACARFNA